MQDGYPLGLVSWSEGYPVSYTIKDILRIEVAPALGCTEPSAVALAAAAASSLIDRRIESIRVTLDPNLYKNGMAVAIPGAGGSSGIELAAALGALGGDPRLKLEVLAPIDDAVLCLGKGFVREGKVSVALDDTVKGIYVLVSVGGPDGTAEAEIREVHDNLIALRLNGKELEAHALLSSTSRTQSELSRLEAWLKERSLAELLLLLDGLDEDDLAFLREGVDVNLKLAEYGIKTGCGLGVGLAFERLIREGLLKRDMVTAARRLTSAASDARMSGAKLPAMSSGGSGNHGLTAILPIWAVKDYLDLDGECDVLRAIALSHVITAYVKAHTGRLSAVCGCSIAAGAGATAGIVLLMGGSINHIAGAIKNLIEDLAGVICDGAKNSCSLKLSTAAGTAVQAALFSLRGIQVSERDGIIDSSPEQTMRNVGDLSTQGMIEADRTILRIMANKQFSVD